MCGRVTLKTDTAGLMRAFADVTRAGGDGLDALTPRRNGAPRQQCPLIIREPDLPGPVFMIARWGLIPRWIKDEDGGRQPINSRSEGSASNGKFRAAHRSRRPLTPVDGFFERKAFLGSKVKQPFAIATKSGRPFALAAIWEACGSIPASARPSGRSP